MFKNKVTAKYKTTAVQRLDGGFVIKHKTQKDGTLLIEIFHPYQKTEIGTPYPIAHLHVANGRSEDVYVDEKYRRRGFATAMYVYAEKFLKKPLKRGSTQSPDGNALWSMKDRPFGNSLSQVVAKTYPKQVDSRELLHLYYSMTPDSKGSDRVERVLKEAGCDWKLVDFPIADIPWHGNPCSAPSSSKLIDKYAKLTTEYPPIILDDAGFGVEIVDGFHRVAAAKKRGDKTIKAYVPG